MWVPGTFCFYKNCNLVSRLKSHSASPAVQNIHLMPNLARYLWQLEVLFPEPKLHIVNRCFGACPLDLTR